jgi:hypothetical protein
MKESKLPYAFLTSESDHFYRYAWIWVILAQDMPAQGLLYGRDEK